MRSKERMRLTYGHATRLTYGHATRLTYGHATRSLTNTQYPQPFLLE
ncbi:MAG: hypothetical protein F6K26_50645 [Moorea sp. SIO2I5]|nr:hypothetical protein [Moorena sp. SIO2I5]